MTKVMFLLQKRPDMSREAFRRHWRDTHAPLAAQLPGIRRLVLNHPLRDAAQGTPAYDGIAEQWYASSDAVRVALSSPELQTALADGPNFLDMDALRMLVLEEEELAIPLGQASHAAQ